MDKEIMTHSEPKAVYSITGICLELGLSRSQFYNLQKRNVMPPSLKEEKSGRSYLDDRLLQICQHIKKSGIAYNGKPYLFYRPRQKTTKIRQVPDRKQDTAADPSAVELSDTLLNMGIKVSSQEVSQALQQLHPDIALNQLDSGEILRELYKYFRQIR
jgi:hypothetical protein